MTIDVFNIALFCIFGQMKHLVVIAFFAIAFLTACDNRSPYYHLVMGKWAAKDSLTELVYEFKQDRFKRTGTYDTVELWIEGSYFINENEKRHTVTMCLVPDSHLALDEDFMGALPVENLDILSINGNRMVVMRSNYVKGKLGNTWQNKNDTLWRIDD